MTHTAAPSPVGQAVQPEEDDEEFTNAILFSNRRIEKPGLIVEEKVPSRPAPVRMSDPQTLAEDDDLEIPAFIRRKMKK
jgi:hypothetical protein